MPLAAFYGVGIGRGRGRPQFKIYLSPSAAARGAEARLLGRACERLGLGASWNRIRAAHDRHWTLACLDLAGRADARFKIYETLTDADRSFAARLDGTATGDSIEDLAAALCAMLPPSVRGFSWGMLSHTLLPSGKLKRTFGISIRPGAPQGPVRQCVEALLARLGLDSQPYTRCFRAAGASCDEPVEHSYVTVQRMAGGAPRVTAYFAPRLYQARFGVFEAPVWPSPVSAFALEEGSG